MEDHGAPMKRWLKRAALACIAACTLAFLGLVGARIALARPLPTGVPGPEAAALGDQLAHAVDSVAWDHTGAVRFSMFGASFLWDRERNLVRFSDRTGIVLTEGWRPMGRAFKGGEQVGGDWKDKRVKSAYEQFINASFWAFAPFKMHDEGALLSRAPGGLLVSYPTGGVTPGEAYQWELSADGTPVAWRIWAAALPLPGARFSWADWTTLATGAKVATTRRSGPIAFHIDELAGATTLAELEPGPDPFAAMFGP